MLRFSVTRTLEQEDVFYIQISAQESFLNKQFQESSSYVMGFCKSYTKLVNDIFTYIDQASKRYNDIVEL